MTSTATEQRKPRQQRLKKTPARTLIDGYQREIWYDCHRLETRVSRSDYRELMLRRGNRFLRHIGRHLLKQFPRGGFFKEPRQDDLFVAWGYLLYDFAAEDKRLKRLLPYSRQTSFGEQNMRQWALHFCFRAAQLPKLPAQKRTPRA